MADIVTCPNDCGDLIPDVFYDYYCPGCGHTWTVAQAITSDPPEYQHPDGDLQ